MITTAIHSVSDVRVIRIMPGNGNAVTTQATTTCGEDIDTTHYFHTAEKAWGYFRSLGGTEDMICANPETLD